MIEDYISAIQDTEPFCLKAVFDVSRERAEKVATDLHVDAYFDQSGIQMSLKALFGRQDVQAVIITMPLEQQVETIQQALDAGINVLSENPISQNVEHARRLIEWYTDQYEGDSLWSVSENLRFSDPILYAYHQVQKLEGRIVAFSIRVTRKIASDELIWFGID